MQTKLAASNVGVDSCGGSSSSNFSSNNSKRKQHKSSQLATNLKLYRNSFVAHITAQNCSKQSTRINEDDQALNNSKISSSASPKQQNQAAQKPQQAHRQQQQQQHSTKLDLREKLSELSALSGGKGHISSSSLATTAASKSQRVKSSTAKWRSIILKLILALVIVCRRDGLSLAAPVLRLQQPFESLELLSREQQQPDENNLDATDLVNAAVTAAELNNDNEAYGESRETAATVQQLLRKALIAATAAAAAEEAGAQPPKQAKGLLQEENDAQVASNDQDQESEFWIERRRAERARGLEPPAWLRQRPVRRLPEVAADELANEASDEQHDDKTQKPLEQFDVRVHRRGDSLANIYDELLATLLAAALDEQKLYKDLAISVEQRQQQQQLDESPETPETPTPLKLNSNTGSQLVLVGDDVAASSAADVEFVPGVGLADAGQSAPLFLPMSPLGADAGTTSGFEGGANDGLATGAVSSIAASSVSQQQPQQQQDSFHVVEDIDRAPLDFEPFAGSLSAVGDVPRTKRKIIIDDGYGDEDADIGIAANKIKPSSSNINDNKSINNNDDNDNDIDNDDNDDDSDNDAINKQIVATRRMLLARRNASGKQPLLELANSLGRFRRQLEIALLLPRDSIVNVFPVSAQYLLLKIDESRLSLADVWNLRGQQLDSVDGGYLLVAWPQAASALTPLANFARVLPAESVAASGPFGIPRNYQPALFAQQQSLSPELVYALLASAASVRQRNLALPAAASDGADLEPLLSADTATGTGGSSLMYVCVMLGALFASLVAVKLRLHSQRGRNESHLDQHHHQGEQQPPPYDNGAGGSGWPRCWPFAATTADYASGVMPSKSSGGIEAEYCEHIAGDGQKCGIAPPTPPPFVGAGFFTGLGEKLSWRMPTLQAGTRDGLDDDKDDVDDDDAETDSISRQNSNDDAEKKQPGGSFGQLRSSSSYIKSLMEALARVHRKATTATISTPRKQSISTAAASTEVDLDGNECRANLLSEPSADATQDELELASSNNSDEHSAPVESQMDISAAHLILGYLERHLNERERLARDWSELSGRHARANLPAALRKTTKTALSVANASKNRAPNALPYDKNRVKLCTADAVASTMSATGAAAPPSNYINASYLHDDEPRTPTHIVAQAPTEQTLVHFWQMIWEQRVSVVVALTRLAENNNQMCAFYWPTTQTNVAPNNKPTVGGSPQKMAAAADSKDRPTKISLHVRRDLELEVHLVSEHITCADFLVRNMCLVNSSSGETRTVTQFHYLAWPEAGVPQNVRSFLHFRRKVNKCYRQPKSPILVHCSTGAGRAGTYVLVDTILNRISRGAKEINIAATLEHLREQRMNLVQNKAQFEFALTALAEEIQFILSALPQ